MNRELFAYFLILVSLQPLIMACRLYYGYNFSKKLYFFMYPAYILLLLFASGLFGIFNGIKILNHSRSIIKAYLFSIGFYVLVQFIAYWVVN